MHGSGNHRWPDGRVYEGNWVTDKYNGRGRYLLLDGRVYEADWVDGQFNHNVRWSNMANYIPLKSQPCPLCLERLSYPVFFPCLRHMACNPCMK